MIDSTRVLLRLDTAQKILEAGRIMKNCLGGALGAFHRFPLRLVVFVWWYLFFSLHTLKLTHPLKMDGWNTSFLLGWPIFRGYVSFREGTNHLV